MIRPGSPSPHPPRSRVVIDVGKGLLASATIVAVLIGVPWLLLAVIGTPVGDLTADLTDPLSSDNTRAAAALRLGLTVVVWLAWLQVAWALVIEVAAAALGRAAGRSRLLVPAVQRSAGKLVAAAMLLTTTFTAPVSSSTLLGLQAAPVHSSDAAVAGNRAGLDLDLTTDDRGDATLDVLHAGATRSGVEVARAVSSQVDVDGPSGPQRHYTVEVGDTFWSIAEATTGDGFAWRAIRDRNLGRLMSNGSPITSDTEAVVPGTVLLVPDVESAGIGQAGAPRRSTPDVASIDVEQGDHFWALAGEALAEGWGRAPSDEEIAPFWSDLIECNRDRLLPPGDPDLIHPGQHFLIPPLPDDPLSDALDTTPGQSDDRLQPSPSPSSVPAPTTPGPQALQSLPPMPAESTTNGLSVTDPPSTASDAPTPSSAVGVPQTYSNHDGGNTGDDLTVGRVQPTENGDADDGVVPLGVVAITGIGLLTAAVARILRRRQSHRMGMRRNGRGPDFSPPAMTEQLLATTADEHALDDLDTALRHLGAELERADLAVPELVGAMVGASFIRLVLGSRHDAAPAPFRCERDGMMWTVRRPMAHADLRRAQGPFPALVTMGHTDDAQLLIDLEYVGLVHMSGGLADVIDTMGTMAFELATSPLADTIEVVCVGFGEELGDLERVTVVPTLDVAIERIESHAQANEELAAGAERNGPQGRVSSTGDWTPLVVFDPLSELSPATKRLVAAVGLTAACGVSAVVTTADPDALTVQLTEDRLSIQDYDVRLSRRVLDRVQRAGLAAALADAANADDVERPDLAAQVLENDPSAPTGASAPSPAEDLTRARSGSHAEGDEETDSTDPPPIVVRLLGPLRVETASGDTVVFDRSATPEFLAYLTHHRNGVGVDEAMNTLWPATTARRTWIANVHADARRSLGELAGDGAVPRAGVDDRYGLSPLVASDFELFRQGAAAAVDLPLERAVEVLVGALELVEGIPYTNVTNRWPTAEGHWQEATMLVDEAARCVATLALDQLDDPRLAAWAAAKGLLASPHSVALHRLRLQAAMADGGDDLGPDAVFQHYQATVMADEHRPEGGARLDPAIVELYESYRRSRSAV